MRIAWFLSGELTVAGESVSSVLASNRLRCLELVSALEKQGHEVTLIPIDKIEMVETSEIFTCDIAIIGKVFRDLSGLYRILKDHQMTIIADICDDPFALNHLRKPYESLIYWCDSIVASSNTLADSLRQYTNKRIDTIPDCLEATPVSPTPIEESAVKPLSLLWFGQPSNLQGLVSWLPALSEYSRRQIKLCLMTRVNPKLQDLIAQWQTQWSSLEITLESWSLDRAVIVLDECDVVLVPSTLDSSTAAKTANRLHRALCAGKTIIASPVPSFLEMAPFVHITESVGGELDSILNDVSAEVERVKAGQAYILEKYCAQSIAAQWNNKFELCRLAVMPGLIDTSTHAGLSERHLMIFWNHALPHIEPLMAELMTSSFTVESVIKTSWIEQHFPENLARFYGKNKTDIVAKLDRIGAGDFIVVILRDDTPNYGYRVTSRGVRTVNLNIFDAKIHFRNTVSGSDLIHATNDQAEFECDFATLYPLSMRQSLLASTGENWTGEITEYSDDVAGVRDWESLADLFDALNISINYVVLRNYDCLPDYHDNSVHGDIDLLVEDFVEAQERLGAQKVFSDPYRVHVEVCVAGEKVRFDLRYVGDNYFDPAWQRLVLAQRIFDPRGFYRPDPINHFYVLIHHIVINKRFIAPDYVSSLIAIGHKFGFAIEAEQWRDRDHLMQILVRYMKNQNFQFIAPKDRSVNFLIDEKETKPAIPLSDLDYLAAAVLETERLEPIYEKRNAYFHSRVWRVKLPGRDDIAIKRVSASNGDAFRQLCREHEFLLACQGEGVVQCIDHCVIDNDYILIMPWIDGYNLWDDRARFLAIDQAQQAEFWNELEAGIKRIGHAQVEHRDLWAKNVIVQNNKPVIIDFGWACFRSQRTRFTPDSLRCPSDVDALSRMQQEVLAPVSSASIN